MIVEGVNSYSMSMMMQVEQYACNVYTLTIVLELLDEFTRSEFGYCVWNS